MDRRDKKRTTEYETSFVLFSDQVEKWLLRLAVGMSILLVLAQFALLFSQPRQWLGRTERMEGTPIQDAYQEIVR